MIGHKKYFCAQSKANIYRAALMILYEEIFPQIRLFAEHVWLPQEASPRRVFSENGAHKTKQIL